MNGIAIDAYTIPNASSCTICITMLTQYTLFNVLFQNGAKHDASTNYVDASTCYKKSDPKDAAASLQKAIDIYTESGRYAPKKGHQNQLVD